MSDWIGLIFFVVLLIGVFAGLRILASPRTRTSEEFERNAAKGTTMLGASINALQAMMNPEAAKAKEVEMQMKDGRYQRKKREGKANADSGAGDI